MFLLKLHMSFLCCRQCTSGSWNKAVVFFFNDTATTEIYTLSLHDALPILIPGGNGNAPNRKPRRGWPRIPKIAMPLDRKSTRLNSSHANISYAVFCLKKKKRKTRLLRNAVNVRAYICTMSSTSIHAHMCCY